MAILPWQSAEKEMHTRSRHGPRMDSRALFGGSIFSVVIVPPVSPRAFGAYLADQP